jgi:CRISPR/Cas system CMR subunit Cmr4 (Cas7 group RAMP superfamily)
MNVGEGGPFIREDFPQNVVLFLILDIDKRPLAEHISTRKARNEQGNALKRKVLHGIRGSESERDDAQYNNYD